MSRGQRLTIHGRDHRPGGVDPIFAGEWHVVGDTGEPAFQNGWANFGSGYASTMFRLVVGPYGTLSVTVVKQTLEIVLAVNGGSANSTIFTLPAGFFDWAGGLKVPGHAHTLLGVYRPYHVDGATGDVVDGV